MKGTAHGNKKPFDTKIKVNTCTNFVLGHLNKKTTMTKKKKKEKKKMKKKMEKSTFTNFTYVIVTESFCVYKHW